MSKYTDEQLEQAKEAFITTGALSAYADDHLEKRGLNTYVCPFCGSGNGRNRSAAFTVSAKDGRFKCFSCGEGGDVLDLVKKCQGIDGYVEQIEAVAEFAHIPLLEDEGKGRALGWNDTARVYEFDEIGVVADENSQPATSEYSAGREEAREYIRRAQANVTMPDAVEYITERGFTMEEARRFGFGYDPNAGGAKDEDGNWCRRGRIVIPWAGSDYYYISRSIDPTAKVRKYDKPETEKVGPQPMHNPGALRAEVVFVVEGLLDACALEAMGFHAIAMAGTGSEKTLRAISSRDYRGTLILMFDNDKPGRRAEEVAAKFASELRLDFITASEAESEDWGPYKFLLDDGTFTEVKDACEALQTNRHSAWYVFDAMVTNTLERRKLRAYEALKKALKAAKLQQPIDVASAIFNCQDTDEPIPTGIRQLDIVTNGGLRPGLTVLGATSSAGKTTLVSQIGDTMASRGYPVLFCTIEQSASEIVGKSLSRIMGSKGYKGVGIWEMTTRSQREQWPDSKTSALYDAYTEYVDTIAPRLMIMAAEEQPNVEDIKAAVVATTQQLGRVPVVIIDYLQLLAPANPKQTDKQAVDDNVRALRVLARDEKIPVIVISSLNRASYSGQIEQESFKESGMVEYSADLLIGLQPYHMEEKIANIKGGKDKVEKAAKDMTREFRRKTVRECELVILKNRNGVIPPKPLPLTFYAAESLFVEGVVG